MKIFLTELNSKRCNKSFQNFKMHNLNTLIRETSKQSLDVST